MARASRSQFVSFNKAAVDLSKPASKGLFSTSSVWEKTGANQAGSGILSPQQELFRAVLRSFSDVAVVDVDRLAHLRGQEWQRLLYWLDISGLALYFLDRLTQLGLAYVLPQSVFDRLQENFRDNILRTRSMIEESIAIQHDFQKAGLSYAVMKGLSLTPDSVPRPELRHQLDLDYLVAETSAPEARQILERRGYRLYAISEKTWEFKIHETPHVSMKDLYKNLPYRAVELHLESATQKQASRLKRVVFRDMFGMTMPVFSPVDLFLGQAMHAFKDVCSAFSRAAHLLELYRHVLTHRYDVEFWSELRNRAGDDQKVCLGIGVVSCLLASIMGEFAPEALNVWTVEQLPASIRLWIELYGQRAAFSNNPGTKLYLLLQKELEAAGVPRGRPIKKSLWPSRLPPLVVRAVAGEAVSIKIARYRLQLRFILSRMRFHLVEGLRYAVEFYRWRKYLDRLS